MPSADDIIKQLVQGQEAVVRTARRLFPLLDKVSDEPTAELPMQRCRRLEATLVAGQQLMPGQGIQVAGNKTIVALACRTAI